MGHDLIVRMTFIRVVTFVEYDQREFSKRFDYILFQRIP